MICNGLDLGRERCDALSVKNMTKKLQEWHIKLALVRVNKYTVFLKSVATDGVRDELLVMN